MGYKKIKKDQLKTVLTELSKEYVVLLPSRSKGQIAFAPWDGENADFLDWYKNTVVPPKALFFPPVEEMFHFRKGEEGYEVEELRPEEGPRVIFGIRPCDAKALETLDILFADTYRDPYYLARRENCILIGLGCNEPCDTCFCMSYDISPGQSEAVDLLCTDTDGDLLIEAKSDKGRELLSKMSGVSDASSEEESKANELREAAKKRISRQIDLSGLEEKMRTNFENREYWKKVSMKCMACGICTYVCPTCHCFDIHDEHRKKEGRRIRNWDSCKFSLFTRMPMENPRREKWRRIRQRYHHKFEYYPMNFGAIACTGCGRCIRECPVNVDVTEIIGGIQSL
ncbi:MAG: 4Fe-4S dicluster domain-containing protein [Pseudomonadota bacterium]